MSSNKKSTKHVAPQELGQGDPYATSLYLTWEKLLKLATTLKDVRSKMMMPGVTLSNSKTDYFPINTLQLVRFNDKELKAVVNVTRLKRAETLQR